MHLAQDNDESTHSRRADPIRRSAKPFCQAEAGAEGLSRMPMAHSAHDHAAINPVTIAGEVVQSLVPSECLRLSDAELWNDHSLSTVSRANSWEAM